MKSPGGVRLPGEYPLEPCDWTADSLMDDFEEFLEAAFTVAHILDGSPPF